MRVRERGPIGLGLNNTHEHKYKIGRNITMTDALKTNREKRVYVCVSI
jgi:hypothetical protein